MENQDTTIKDNICKQYESNCKACPYYDECYKLPEDTKQNNHAETWTSIIDFFNKLA